MVEVEIEDKWVNIDNTPDNAIGEIIGEGTYGEPKEVAWSKTPRKMFNIPMKFGEKNLDYSPFDDALKKLVAAWGKESKEWIGKKIQFFHLNKKLVIKPIVEQKVE